MYLKAKNPKFLLIQLKHDYPEKNIIKYGIMIGEEAIPIEQNKGDIIIPVINKQQINNTP